MFYLHTVLCNIKRNRAKSIITICICIFVYILLNLYFNNIYISKLQLKSVANIIPIYCRVTNLNGSLETGLEISEDLVNNLQSSTKIKDLAFSVRMVAGVGEFPLEDWKQKLNLSVVGANTVTAIAGLSLEDIHMKDKVSDFFTSTTPICIVNESIMEKYQLAVGDTITLNLFYKYYDERKELHYSPLELMPVEIIGTMDAIVSTTEQLPPDVLFPFEIVRESFHRKEITFKADSTSFYVADPLQLNAFKKEMKSFGLLDKSPASEYSYQGNVLSVRDTTFRTLASQLRQSIDTLQNFFPLICFIIIIIGYITSFLLINSRQKEFALMRALGASRGRCFLLFFIEQLVLILFGEIVGGGVAILLFCKVLMVAIAGNIFLFSYLLGCMVALWRMGKTSVTKALFCPE